METRVILETFRTWDEVQFLVPEPLLTGLVFFKSPFGNKPNVIDIQGYGKYRHDRGNVVAGYLAENHPVEELQIPEHQRFGINNGRKLWFSHELGHDYYVFDLTKEKHTLVWGQSAIQLSEGRKPLIYTRVSDTTLSQIVLVGEGNALRKARRYLAYAFKQGQREFTTGNLDQLQKYISYKCDCLIVFESGAVLSIRDGKLVENYSLPINYRIDLVMNWSRYNLTNEVCALSNQRQWIGALNQVAILGHK